MAHPTQPVPKSSAWEQAQGTMLHQLHLSNCIVVIEIWKPRDLIFLLLCVSHSPFYLLLLVHSLALTRYRPLFFKMWSHSGVVTLKFMNYKLKTVTLKHTIIMIITQTKEKKS